MENSSTAWTRSRDDGLFALAGVVLCVITYALYVGQLTTNQKILMFIVSLGYTLPTAFRRDNTTLTTAIIICTATLRYFAFPTLVLPMDFLVLLALYTVILCGSRTLGIATGAFVAAGSLVFWVPRVWPFTEDSAIRFCLANSILVATYALGIARRSRSAIEEELRRSTEQAQVIAERESHLAVVEERGRISRDMHDIVAHTLAVVVAQADGGRYAGRKNPDSGTVKTLDRVVNTMDDERSAMRRDTISILLPLNNLVRSLSVGQNLTLGHSINRIAVDQHKYKQVLAAFNLSDIEKVKANTLDTATQLQVAIARSVLRESEVILCADPTINSSTTTSG